MKTAFPRPAAFAAVTLSLVLAAIPAPAEPPIPAPIIKPELAPPPHDRVQPYAHTAIGAVIEANGWKVPATGRELTAALATLGDFVQLPVTFSAVSLHSGLSHPRVVITMRPSTHPPPQSRAQQGGGGWGGGSAQVTRPSPLGRTSASRPYLENRLFLAANTEPGDDGNPVTRTVEFISWNSRAQKFDFGVIEGMGQTPELKILDGVRCFSCHKNKGPILGAAPWSNTAQNELVRSTSAALFKFPMRLNAEGKEDPNLGRRDDVDGLKVLNPSGPEVDAAVRRGADVLRDRGRFKLLAGSANGGKAFVLLLSAIASSGPLDKIDQKLKLEINDLDLVTFVNAANAAERSVAPSVLADFSPAGPVNKPVLAKGNGGVTNQVTRYDASRASGDHGLPSRHQPSNPNAFVRPNSNTPAAPSHLVSAVMLARAIGLSEGDREFLATALDKTIAAKRIKIPDLTPATLAKSVFNGPAFADVLTSGVLPERDDFKDRFVAGLVLELGEIDRTLEFWRNRMEYTSGPRFAALMAEPEPIKPLPTHACAACHDFRNESKPVGFNPIPKLAFDPFDTSARESWLLSATRKQKQDILGRLKKRLRTDKDMPPEDSVEAELYRMKDPSAIVTLIEWLDVELKKVK